MNACHCHSSISQPATPTRTTPHTVNTTNTMSFTTAARLCSSPIRIRHMLIPLPIRPPTTRTQRNPLPHRMLNTRKPPILMSIRGAGMRDRNHQSILRPCKSYRSSLPHQPCRFFVVNARFGSSTSGASPSWNMPVWPGASHAPFFWYLGSRHTGLPPPIVRDIITVPLRSHITPRPAIRPNRSPPHLRHALESQPQSHPDQLHDLGHGTRTSGCRANVNALLEPLLIQALSP